MNKLELLKQLKQQEANQKQDLELATANRDNINKQKIKDFWKLNEENFTIMRQLGKKLYIFIGTEEHYSYTDYCYLAFNHKDGERVKIFSIGTTTEPITNNQPTKYFGEDWLGDKIYDNQYCTVYQDRINKYVDFITCKETQEQINNFVDTILTEFNNKLEQEKEFIEKYKGETNDNI